MYHVKPGQCLKTLKNKCHGPALFTKKRKIYAEGHQLPYTYGSRLLNEHKIKTTKCLLMVTLIGYSTRSRAEAIRNLTVRRTMIATKCGV